VEAATNDWKENPQGEGYLSRLREIGPPDLLGRLVNEHAPAVREEIRRAFQEHAQEALAKHEAIVKHAQSASTPHGADISPDLFKQGS